MNLFSNKNLKNLFFPLFVEQFLLLLVGIADAFTFLSMKTLQKKISMSGNNDKQNVGGIFI